jgi:hypothetical protein
VTMSLDSANQPYPSQPWPADASQVNISHICDTLLMVVKWTR